MKALFIEEPGKAEVREIDPPTPKPDEVLLKIGLVGFCGGDLNAFRGTFPLQQYPQVLGHEIGAVIEETGSEVPAEFKTGDRVTVSPYCNCGTCASCRNNRPNACVDNRTMGVRRPGAMTEYIAVRWQDLHPTEKLSMKELALVEPLTVGFHAVDRGRVTESDTVAVIGCGIVGMGAIAGSAARGAKVIAVDIDDTKLAVAKKGGAAHTVNTAAEDLHETLGGLTGGDGPNVIIEAVGIPATFKAAVEEVAFTGRVVYIGYAKAPVEYETRFFVQKELDILGSRNCLGDFPKVIETLEAGGFPIDDVVSRTVTIDEGPQALADWNANPNAITKMMATIGGEL
jgi:threonine dehydrogenase-like Zn-dependent dehydrogenase